MSKIEFKITKDKFGNKFVKCFNSDNYENVLAVMVEDIKDTFEEPLYLKRTVDVSIPVPSEEKRTLISIWYSTNENPDDLSSVIQAYFENYYSDQLSKNNYSMQINKTGELFINKN